MSRENLDQFSEKVCGILFQVRDEEERERERISPIISNLHFCSFIFLLLLLSISKEFSLSVIYNK